MSDYQLYCGDCLDILPTLAAGSVDAVVTDPPYPDYHTDKYGFVDISFLRMFPCRQFIFWSSKENFPLDYTAIHIWDKKTGAGSEYERIFERNGQSNYKVFRYYFVNSTVAASFVGDEFTGHPSQKPIKLMRRLVDGFTDNGATVFDPFMGSGSTGIAAIQTGRKFIGTEKDPKYFEIAKRRIEQAQPPLFVDAPAQPKAEQAQLEI